MRTRDAAAALAMLAVAGCSSSAAHPSAPAPASPSPLVAAPPTASPSSGASGSPASAAAAAVDHAIALATDKGSVKLHVVFSGSHTGSEDYAIGRTLGSQTVTLGAAHAEVRFIGGKLYVRGDEAGLTGYFQLSAALAPSLANTWLAVGSNADLYSAAAEGLTISSAMDETKLDGTVTTLPATTFGGEPVAVYKGTDAQDEVDETLYVSSSTGLPVGFVESGGGVTVTGHFSDWGTQVLVDTPTGAVQYNPPPVASPTP